MVEAIKAVKKKVSKGFTPRLKVTLRVGNEFEGETYEIIHEVDTLSTLLAEQEATKAARKKFRYVEVTSVIKIQMRDWPLTEQFQSRSRVEENLPLAPRSI